MERNSRFFFFFFLTFIEECCVVIEKEIDKKLANRISYQIWYKGCLKGKFGRGSKSAKGGSISAGGFGPGEVQIRCDTGLQSFSPAESGGINWLSRPKLNQPFRIDSDATLHMNLIRWIWFGSAEVRRLNWALVVSLVVVILVPQTQQFVRESMPGPWKATARVLRPVSRCPHQNRSDLPWCGCRLLQAKSK